MAVLSHSAALARGTVRFWHRRINMASFFIWSLASNMSNTKDSRETMLDPLESIRCCFPSIAASALSADLTHLRLLPCSLAELSRSCVTSTIVDALRTSEVIHDSELSMTERFTIELSSLLNCGALNENQNTSSNCDWKLTADILSNFWISLGTSLLTALNFFPSKE